MPYVNNDKSFASSGVGTAALTTGIIGTFGTALATGILGPGGILGGARAVPEVNPAATPVYQLAQKDTVIAKLEAERSADARFFELSHRMDAVEGRILSMETSTPLRDKILSDSILNLKSELSNICGYMVKASALPET